MPTRTKVRILVAATESKAALGRFGLWWQRAFCETLNTMASGPIGERVAAYRKRRGISQAVLAGLVGRSESWLSQVERGVRGVDRLSVILDLARVLKVEPSKLTGGDSALAHPEPLGPTGLADVRSFLTRYDCLLGKPAGSIDQSELHNLIARVHADYQGAQYSEAVAKMTLMLGWAEASYRDSADQASGKLALDYVSAYVVTAKILTKLGAAELALLAADRAATRAAESESLVAKGMAAYQVVCALLRADRISEAEDLAVGMAGQLEVGAQVRQPTLVSVAGSLWLIAAVIAARRYEHVEASAKLDRAQNLAGLLGEDGNYAWTAFGPTNVQLHRVAVAREMGDFAEAIRLSEALDTSAFGNGLISRRAQVHLDLASAHTKRRRDAEATLLLLEVEQFAPELLCYNVEARHLIGKLLTRSGRTRTKTIEKLATRAGVLD